MTMLELVGALHDIDRIKGRQCRYCSFYVAILGGHHKCVLGMEPAGADDGCDDFRAEKSRAACA